MHTIWLRNVKTGQLFEIADRALLERLRSRRDGHGQPIFERVDPPETDEAKLEFDPAEASP